MLEREMQQLLNSLHTKVAWGHLFSSATSVSVMLANSLTRLKLETINQQMQLFLVCSGLDRMFFSSSFLSRGRSSCDRSMGSSAITQDTKEDYVQHLAFTWMLLFAKYSLKESC